MDGKGYIVGPIHDRSDRASVEVRRSTPHPFKDVSLTLVVSPFLGVIGVFAMCPRIFQYSIERLSREIQTRNGKIVPRPRVANGKPNHNTKTLSVALKSIWKPRPTHKAIKFLLCDVPKRGMTEVMRDTCGLGSIHV